MKYWKYLKYLLKHKWYVTIECFTEGLYWRGIKHDMSKFLPSEFIPYANHFYGQNCCLCSHLIWGSQCDFNGSGIGNGKQAEQCKDFSKKQIRDSTGYYKPTDTGDFHFDFAWLLHQKRNDHHWQWWVLPEDEGKIKILQMSYLSRTEMICDWVGAGKAQGYFSPKNDRFYETRNWYIKNISKMQIDKAVKKLIEEKIGIARA